MAKQPNSTSQVTFFEMREEGEAFVSSVTRLVGQLVRHKAGSRIPLENHQAYSHGRTWRHPANEHATTGEMQTHGAEVTIPFDAVINNDFSVVPQMIQSIVQQFDEAYAQMFYNTISEVCEATGQTVDAREKPFPEAFMEAFRKLEFAVDRDGNPSVPEIHVGSMEMVEQLKAMGNDYQAEFERLKQQKMDSARAAEAERRNRFKRPKP